MLREQVALKEDILECLRKRKDCQERQKQRENQLQQLQKELEEKAAEVATQEAVTSPFHPPAETAQARKLWVLVYKYHSSALGNMTPHF